MCLLRTILLVISVKSVFTLDPSVEDQVLSGRVSVAQCRTKCLGTFKEDVSREECWSLCQHLGDSVDDQSHICHHEKCQEGCQAACGFYFQSNINPKRKANPKAGSLKFSLPPSLDGCSLSWGQLDVSPNTLKVARDLIPSTRTVYLVMGQDKAGQWYEVTQTSGTGAIIDGTMTAKLNQLSVVAVREDGFKATMAFMTDGTNCEEIERKRIEFEAERNRETVDMSLKPSLEFLSLEKMFAEATLLKSSISHQLQTPGTW